MSLKPLTTSTPDARKTKKALLAELRELRAQMAVLKGGEASNSTSDALQESRSRLEAVFKSMAEGVVISDAHGNIISFNDAALKIHRYKDIREWRRNLYDFPDIFELYSPNGRPLPVEEWPLGRALRGEVFTGMDVVVKRKDTDYEGVWSYGGAPIYDANNNVALAALTVEDITERRQAEEALKAREEKFRATFEQSAVGMTHVSLDGRFLSVNKKYCDITGYTENELLGLTVADITYPADVDAERANMKSLLAGEFDTFSSEKRYVRKDGSLIWIKLTVTIVHDKGKPSYLTGITEDIHERKRAEEQLREINERYKLVVNGAQGAIWDWDVLNKRVFYTHQFKELRGLTDEEVTDSVEEWSSRIHPEDAPRVMAAVQAHFEGRTPVFAEEYRILCKDGSWKWVADRGMARRDAAGNVVRMAGSETDITERAKAEEALRESRALLRAVIEGIPDPIFVKDRQSRIIMANPATLRVFDKPLEEVVGKDDRELYADPAVGDAIMANDRRIMESGRTEVIEEVGQTPEGYRTFISTKIPYRNSNGEVIGILGIARDITERKRIEVAWRESEERFKAFMDYSRAIAWMKDAHGRYVYMNKTYEKEFRVLSQERIGKTDFELWPREIAEEFRKSDLEVLVSGRPAQVVEETPNLDGSTTFWFDIKFPFRDASGNMFVGGIGIDITRQKQTEEALKEAKSRNELYVDLMGHDINNINQVVMAYLEIAGESSDNGDKELIQKALDALKSSGNLIENVQKLKKLKSGGLRAEVVDLNDALLALKDQYSGSVGKDVKIIYEPSPGCKVMANGLLKDVFSNIIGNAVKHNPRDHVAISIKLSRPRQDDKKYYQIAIEDDGPGIPDEMKPKIFNRFERGDTRARGKGLGLYLVKTLVDDFHGKVWVEDRVAGDSTRGSRFVVVLPAIDGKTRAVTSNLPHIGVVEDDGTMLNLYQMILTKNGLPVSHTAMNGIEAIDMVRNANPRLDIIIMDHRMPGMTGLEAMREIRKIAPRIKIIFVSADSGIKDEALKSGANKFLHKPVKPKDIVKAVNEALADKQMPGVDNVDD